MTNTPNIIVQLIHIEGPLKNEIMEFSEPEILIGRLPSCHVRFPNDVSTISRVHARIMREGNRFKIIDQSANGTFLNGIQIQESYLKDGDVLVFAEQGPKVSFLTTICDAQAMPEKPSSTVSATPSSSDSDQKPIPPRQPEIRPVEDPVIEKKQVPLMIQYGPTLRDFKELPVIIGKNPTAHFVIDHPEILDQHAQLFYQEGRYWIKDLTGLQKLIIEGRPASGPTKLEPNSVVSLSPRGPKFRFLGGGRLIEIEEAPPIELPAAEQTKIEKIPSESSMDKISKKAIAVFKKYFLP